MNKWIDDLAWSNPAKQARGERTIDALLDAAERLIAEGGVEAASIAEIARRAGCSVGAVYHHFKDKEALQKALFNRMAEAFAATTDEALNPSRWEGASIADILRGYLEFSFKVARENPVDKQAAYDIAKTNPAMQARLFELEKSAGDRLRRLLLERKDDVRRADPELAIRVVIDQCSAMIKLRKEGAGDTAQTSRRSDATIVEEVLKGAAAYLRTD